MRDPKGFEFWALFKLNPPLVLHICLADLHISAPADQGRYRGMQGGPVGMQGGVRDTGGSSGGAGGCRGMQWGCNFFLQKSEMPIASEQARQPRSYASLKLRLTDRLAHRGKV